MTRKETLDAGLAFVLILLIIALALKSHLLVAVAALAVLVCMTVPGSLPPGPSCGSLFPASSARSCPG